MNVDLDLYHRGTEKILRRTGLLLHLVQEADNFLIKNLLGAISYEYLGIEGMKPSNLLFHFKNKLQSR